MKAWMDLLIVSYPGKYSPRWLKIIKLKSYYKFWRGTRGSDSYINYILLKAYAKNLKVKPRVSL